MRIATILLPISTILVGCEDTMPHKCIKEIQGHVYLRQDNGYIHDHKCPECAKRLCDTQSSPQP